MNQQIRIYTILSAQLHIFTCYIFAKCINDHTTSATLSSILLKCHKNTNRDQFCESQLMINIRISPSFHVDNMEKYLILDEAYEPIKKENVKLMSPYLVVISRGEPIIMYPLQYEKAISIKNNKQCPANMNITKCPSEISSSKSIECQQPLSEDSIAFDSKNKERKQRQTVPRSKSLSQRQLRKEGNSFVRRRFDTANESKKIIDVVSINDGRLSKELPENVLSKMGLIRVIESPENVQAVTPNILPELSYQNVEQKKEDEGQQVKSNNSQSLLSEHYIKNDVDSNEAVESNKFKTNTRKDWSTDYYDPLNDPNAYARPVMNFNDQKVNARPVNDFHYPKVHGKPVRPKQKKSKTSKKKEWMADFYDQSNDPLWSPADGKWSPKQYESFPSVEDSMTKSRINQHEFSSDGSSTHQDGFPMYQSPKDNLYTTYNNPVYQPYSRDNQIDFFNVNENADYDLKHSDEEAFGENQLFRNQIKQSNAKHSGVPYFNPYSTNYVKRRYNAMPSHEYRYAESPKRIKRDTLDYDISHLDESPYMREIGESSCDTCGGKNRKTGGKPGFVLSSMNPSSTNDAVPCDTCGGKNKKTDGKPGCVLSSINPSKSTDNNIQGFQTRDNDAIPCDSCGGKNKKPGGTSLPSRNVHNSQGQYESINENLCNCHENMKNNNAKSGQHACICLTNSEFCNCDSSKATRALTKNCKANSSYSIYNMSIPIPFLITKVRIFRKRHKTWWRIAPSITLNSLSGLFANGNLSILFSSHIDILELDRSLYLQNHKLVVPKCGVTKSEPQIENLKGLSDALENAFLFDCSEGNMDEFEIKETLQNKHKKEAKSNVIPVKSIADLGYFPTSLSALQKCPNNDQRLCLNVLDEKVPAFSVKIKMPFRENAVIIPNIFKVKISRIVTDATTKDALQIWVDVINKGPEAKEFLIYVSNCPLSYISSTKANVRKLLLPYIGETITFLLPFTMGSKKNSKFNCDVFVKAIDETMSTRQSQAGSSSSIVAKRSMDIQTHSRCFCVWRCQCHCIEKLETHVNFNICKKLGYSDEREAGLLLNCPPGNEEHDVCLMDDRDEDENKKCDALCKVLRFNIVFLIILLLLGLLKAVLGLCFDSISRWGYDAVQPGRIYACESFARIFLVNVFFFIIFSFVFWCKCFKPRKEDLMVASTEWYCNPENSSESESKKKKSTLKSRMYGGSDQIYDIPEHVFKVFEPHEENARVKDDTDDDEKSTEYIIKILGESKQSLTALLIQRQNEESIQNSATSEKTSDDSPKDKDSDAKEFVGLLTNAQIVYRMMETSMGGLQKIPQNYRYCVQGFFLRSQGETYEFVNYHPFTQYFIVSEENNKLEELASPIYLYTNEFSRIYSNKTDVFEAGDLSVLPPIGVPCINIAQGNLESSLCQLTTQQGQQMVDPEQHDDLSEH